MGTQLKGVNLKGIRFLGAEYLEPTQIVGCVAWFKWKEGINTSAGLLNAWDSQVVGIPSMTYWSGTRRPTYNVTTGAIQGDGVDDFTYCHTTLSYTFPEYWFVLGPPYSEVFFGRDRLGGGGSDADALAFRARSNGQAQKDIAVTSTQSVRTVVGAFNTANTNVFAFRAGQIFINGVEPVYETRHPGSFQATDPLDDGRQTLCSNQRNTGGFPALPSFYSTTKCYEWCWFNRHLTTLEKTKLATYFKLKHQIV